MKRKTVTIINKLGLHARAAAKFVQIASSFESEINVRSGTREANGKSIMGIMMLAAAKGSKLDILTSGTDEEEALTMLENLINDRFGEGQ